MEIELNTVINAYSEPLRNESVEEHEEKDQMTSYMHPSDDSFDEHLKRSKERIMKLKELSLKLKSPSGVNDLEKEPAYRRRNIKLDSTPHSSENNISRFTLSEGEDKKAEIRPNNSFLHGRPD